MIMQCIYYKVYEGYIEFDTMQKGAEKQKTSFPKKNSRKCRLYKPVLNKNNDHIRIMREIHSSFNHITPPEKKSNWF